MRHCITPFNQPAFLYSCITSLALLLCSFVVNIYAGLYATEKASNPVTDIVLSNIPAVDVSLVFIYGPFILWALVAGLCIQQPYRIPFTLKSISLFVLIRSVFISLTHIGLFPTATDFTSATSLGEVMQLFTFGGDLFFSAHTGLPFLMALLFWPLPFWRWFFTLSAVFFGVIVLLGHLHYSIDVLAAFFITYTIAHIARWTFPVDARLFDSVTPVSSPTTL
ncbi:hypothetical protein H6771_01410 [Candidatus Peribacteria bacterium]|nr:hypothetical protein [Candidatus Peribacteria bacterium]